MSYSSIKAIEPLSVALWRSHDTASCIAMRNIIAGQEMWSPGLLPFDLHITADSTVQRHGVPFRSFVVGFHDIDLAIIRPVVPICQPKRWPCATAIGRVKDVEDEEPLVVVSLGFDPDRLTTTSCIGIRSVHLEDDRVICSVGQVQIVCRLLIDVSSMPLVSFAAAKQQRNKSTYCTNPNVGSFAEK